MIRTNQSLIPYKSLSAAGPDVVFLFPRDRNPNEVHFVNPNLSAGVVRIQQHFNPLRAPDPRGHRLWTFCTRHCDIVALGICSHFFFFYAFSCLPVRLDDRRFSTRV